MKSRVLAEPVLVGRELELEELTRYLDSVIEGKGSTVFISGEAGSGKTRLATEFLNGAKQKRLTVLSGWCISEGAVAYFPFVEAFDAYFSPSNKKESIDNHNLEATPTLTKTGTDGIEDYGITAWLTGPKQKEKPGKQETPSPQIWKDQLFSAVAKTLRSISTQSPLILFIEDIHWADSASLALLHYISRVATSEKILVLCTLRSEELTTDAEGHPHPLAELMRQMRREDLFTEIILPNLNQTQVAQTVENMLGGKAQPTLVEKLVKESRGNSLFVVESLRMLVERKCLFLENGEWTLAVDQVGIPSKIKDIILRRLSCLKHDQRRILDAASVIGEKFDVNLLGAVLSQDSLIVLETLNDVAKSTSLVRCEEDYFRFDHTKSREALNEEIPLALKKGYHTRIAEKLEASGKGGKSSLSEIAYHYAEAGNEKKAVKFSMDAGQDALARFSNAEAIKHFAYVVEKVSDDLENDERKRTALEGLGDAYFANSMFAKASEMFERLAGSETGLVRLRAYRKAMDASFWRMGDPDHLMALARKAEPLAAFDRLENARVRFFRGTAFSLFENIPQALKDYEEALQVFEEEYSLPDVARALVPTGGIHFAHNHHRKGMEMLLRSTAIWEEIGDLHGLLDAVCYSGSTIFYFSHMFFQECWDMLAKAVQIGEKTNDYRQIVTARMCLGFMAETVGRFEEAISQIRKATESSTLTDVQYTENKRMYAILARDYAKLGDLKHAEEYLKIASVLPEIYPMDTDLGKMLKLWIMVAQAVVFAAKNSWKEADHYFHKSMETAKTIDPSSIMARFPELFVRENYFWALNKQGRTDEAKTQKTEMDKILGEVEKEFAHFDIEMSLLAPKLVVVGEEFEMRLYLVNVSRKQGLINKIEGLVSPGLKITASAVNCSLQNGSVEFKERMISPLQVATVKLRLISESPGAFGLNPLLTFVDDLGETRTCSTRPFTISVHQAPPKFEVLPGRVPTGTDELDSQLFGGVPERYAVALTSPSTDERELLVKKFLETGAKAGEIVFNVTAEAATAKALAEKYPSNFCLFLCNPQADSIVQSAPNVFKLKGVENLTDIDIALAKAFRTLNRSIAVPKRICIEILSDVLLLHHAVNTRRWLGGLLSTLKLNGFTVLAVLNPQMHPQEEVQAILGLFDGIIAIYEKETPKGTERFLKIKRLSNQKYSKDEICLKEE